MAAIDLDVGQPIDLRTVVLVVEDEVFVRMMLADLLDDAGFRVIEAANGDQALVLLGSAPEIQVVVTDVEMPNGSINGFELARRVRQDWNIGVLITSGRMAPEPGELPPDTYFLGKPYRSDELIELVRALSGPT